jgi:hypothetical protein
LVKSVVSQLTGLKTALLISPRKSLRVSHARWLALALLRARGHSLTQIAGVFGMHHTSVLHALRSFGRTGFAELLPPAIVMFAAEWPGVSLAGRMALASRAGEPHEEATT